MPETTDVLLVHHLAAEYPPIEDEPFADLVEGVRRRGRPLFDVLTWVDPSGRRWLVDGVNRDRACKVAGVPTPYRDLECAAEELPQVIRDANLTRRHLSEAQIAQLRERRVARVAEGVRLGKTYRSLAEEEGVSVATVQRDVDRARERELLPPEPREEEPPGEAPPAEPPKDMRRPVADEILKDDLGVPVPRRLVDVFAGKYLQRCADGLDELVRGLGDAASRWARFLDDNHLRLIKGYVGEIQQMLENARPFAVCPFCQGRGCPDCRRAGYLPEAWVEEARAQGRWPK